MKCTNEHMLLYAVTDRMWLKNQTLAEQVEAALRGGATCVQLREKHLDDDAFLQEALVLSALCKRFGVPFIINDNVDVAIKCQADGIHVGQMDMAAGDVRQRIGKDMILGVSTQTVEQAQKAVEQGADYLGVGAVFSTQTKADAKPLPHNIVRIICNAVTVPVVAIGGITKQNILQLSGTGVDGVALVSAIFAAENIENECRLLLDLSKQMVGSHSKGGGCL